MRTRRGDLLLLDEGKDKRETGRGKRENAYSYLKIVLKIVFAPHLVVVCIIAQLLELDQYAKKVRVTLLHLCAALHSGVYVGLGCPPTTIVL